MLVRAFFGSLAVAAGSLTAPSPMPADMEYTSAGLSPAQLDVIDWALDLFREAELALPPIDFVGHDSTTDCFDRAAAHTQSGGRSRIDICTADTGPVAEVLLLHEIAHAWDRRSLTADTRHAFLAERDLTEWRNHDPDRWHDRGAEHAAEIIMWGLIDRPMRVVRLTANSCADLIAGYRLLTGKEPLHGFTQKC